MGVNKDMHIVDVANEIFVELNEPSTTSIPAISFWLRGNIGQLNSRLHTNYSIDEDTLEFSIDLGDMEKAIFKKLYFIWYYDDFIRRNLGAAAFDSVLEVTSDGATVRLANKNEIAKTYATIKKDEIAALEALIRDYKIDKSGPVAVHGDDTIAALQYYPNREYNRVTKR